MVVIDLSAPSTQDVVKMEAERMELIRLTKIALKLMLILFVFLVINLLSIGGIAALYMLYWGK